MTKVHPSLLQKKKKKKMVVMMMMQYLEKEAWSESKYHYHSPL